MRSTILQDIRACFPSDRNPFYAGFGNRDTDEFSYLKVGIPKGKIFIINPKVLINLKSLLIMFLRFVIHVLIYLCLGCYRERLL